MDMIYASAASPFGVLLAAASSSGLTFVGLWEDEPYLLADLKGRYPGLTLHADPTGIKLMMDTLLAYLYGQPLDLALAVDPIGTAFQQRVWQALLKVPYGKVLSYSGLSASMGLGAQSVRAVAHGCATNPVSLVIPCHRILRSDGSLGGYYWGLARKRALLKMERAIPASPRQPELF
jgi:AraC family transcriptional regulator, regulatory protein of adaptative response / methylated-DNA-[protein]-cysteine methyltransferase